MVEGLTVIQGEIKIKDKVYSTYFPPFVEIAAGFAMLKGGEGLVAQEFDFPELSKMRIAFIDLEEAYRGAYTNDEFKDTYIVHKITPKTAAHEATHRYHYHQTALMQGMTLDEVVQDEQEYLRIHSEGDKRKNTIIHFYQHLVKETLAGYSCARLGFENEFNISDEVKPLMLPSDQQGIQDMIMRVENVRKSGERLIPDLSNLIGSYAGTWLCEKGVQPDQMMNICTHQQTENPFVNYMLMVMTGNAQ